MNGIIAWLAAEAEVPDPIKGGISQGVQARRDVEEARRGEFPLESLRAHQFPSSAIPTEPETPLEEQKVEYVPAAVIGADLEDPLDRNPHLGKYRRLTTLLLRRYMRYALEAGRLPSILGSEFFRTKVTSYGLTTFEERVIFVHDVEICLEELDEFPRELIARHFLQEHGFFATARLLHCNEKSVRLNAPIALDLLSEIFLEKGLLLPQFSKREKSCQGG
jgi:hypothetical protein